MGNRSERQESDMNWGVSSGTDTAYDLAVQVY